jgi:hypothetical protein
VEARDRAGALTDHEDFVAANREAGAALGRADALELVERCVEADDAFDSAKEPDETAGAERRDRVGVGPERVVGGRRVREVGLVAPRGLEGAERGEWILLRRRAPAAAGGPDDRERDGEREPDRGYQPPGPAVTVPPSGLCPLLPCEVEVEAAPPLLFGDSLPQPAIAIASAIPNADATIKGTIFMGDSIGEASRREP